MNTSLQKLAPLPFLFFVIAFFREYQTHSLWNLCWLCHVNNLLLGIALILGSIRGIQIVCPILILGCTFWFMDLFANHEYWISSILSHGGALILAFYLIQKFRLKKNTWILSLLVSILIQQISRFFTAPELNVNTAFFVFTAWEGIFFHSYLLFWAASVFGMFIVYFTLNYFFTASESPLSLEEIK